MNPLNISNFLKYRRRYRVPGSWVYSCISVKVVPNLNPESLKSNGRTADINRKASAQKLKAENHRPKTMMRIKFLLISAIIFLMLGWNSKDGVLFFFFAVHLFTLTIGVFCSRFDKKPHAAQNIETFETFPEADSSES